MFTIAAIAALICAAIRAKIDAGMVLTARRVRAQIHTRMAPHHRPTDQSDQSDQ